MRGVARRVWSSLCVPRSLDKVDGVTGIRIERTGSFRLSKKKLLDPVEDFRANNKTEGEFSGITCPTSLTVCVCVGAQCWRIIHLCQ